MMTLANLAKCRDRFETFLTGRGAQIMQPTNEWEVLRFRTAKCVSIVYRNAKGGVTLTGECDEAWNAFTNGKAWRGTPAAKKRIQGRERKLPFINALLKRDGQCCFFCWLPITEDDRTIEHLVALAHGGPNHLSNMVLAHEKCNQEADCRSAMDKIRIREKNLAALAKEPA